MTTDDVDAVVAMGGSGIVDVTDPTAIAEAVADRLGTDVTAADGLDAALDERAARAAERVAATATSRGSGAEAAAEGDDLRPEETSGRIENGPRLAGAARSGRHTGGAAFANVVVKLGNHFTDLISCRLCFILRRHFAGINFLNYLRPDLSVHS